MDFQQKQWREQQQQHESEQEQPPSAKQPRLFFNPNPHQHQQQLQQQQQQQQQNPSSEALPLFVAEPTSKLSYLSAYPPDDSTLSATKYPRMGSYFSLAQWQELELQAMIFRHMLAGASIPPELLHLLKKSLITSSPYYLPYPLQHYPYYHQSLLQSGYWGRGAMDPEPGRCRRTDGKKWRCSRDVVSGQKYCERHMHRGRNRSRKPVEIPTPANPTGGNAAAGGGAGAGGGGGAVLKNNNPLATQPLAAAISSGGGGTHHFTLSGPSPSIDLLHNNQRTSEPIITNKDPFETQNDVSGDGKSNGRILRHFFDDWPSSLQETGNAGRNASSMTSATNLSISTPGNPSSDFSLKLSTGAGDDLDNHHRSGNVERDGGRSNWVAPWGTNQAASVGGPLAEALRSSMSNSSPTSVLHQLPRGTASEASYAST